MKGKRWEHGVTKYKFLPDLEMAEAWLRMGSAQGDEIDEVLLRHEVYESDLVINQGLNQKEAHVLAQNVYP